MTITLSCSLPACATLTYENIDFMGADKKVVKLDSPAMCEEACTADPDCQFYTFVYNTITARSVPA